MKDRWKEALGAAFAVCAAMLGAGFASGREIATFFTQFGAAGWLGVPLAGACVGWIVYLVLSLAQRTGADSFPGLYGRLMNRACEEAMHLLHGLLCLTTAAAMLSAGGELFALTLPLDDARAMGVVMTLAIGLLLSGRGMGAMSISGGVLLCALAAFYLLVGRGGRVQAGLTVRGAALALPMGALYASFNGALCGGTIVLAGKRAVDPARCALCTGVLVTLVLAAGQGALLHAGGEACALALPSVALAAERWGETGFFLSAVCLLLAVVTTLAGMLLSLRAQAVRFLGERPALSLILPAGLALLLSACGFETLVGVMYPLLGWICVLALSVLPFFMGEMHLWRGSISPGR